MQPSFADWYRSAAVTIPEGRLDKRWAGVKSFADMSNRSSVVALATEFVLPGNENRVPTGFREAFKAQDETFQLRDNLEELRVLAGATLRELIERDGPLATLAALSVVCGSFGPREVPVKDHIDAAQKFLGAHSQQVRDCLTSLAQPGQIHPTKDQLQKSLTDALFAVNQTPTLRGPLIEVLSQFAASLDERKRELDMVTRRVLVGEEELNFLWWLQSEASRDLSLSFADVGPEAGCTVFPSELAELTRFLPGPPWAPAILLRALRIASSSGGPQELTLREAVNAIPRAWRESKGATQLASELEQLSPIHLAIIKSLLTEGADEWPPVYTKACDVSLTRKHSSAELSIQMYHERLLNKSFAEQASA